MIEKFIHGILGMLDIGDSLHGVNPGHIAGKYKADRNFIVEVSGGGKGTCTESVVFLISIAVHQPCGNDIMLGHINI